MLFRSVPVGCLSQDHVALAQMVDAGVHPDARVAIPAQSLDAADCSHAAATEPVGSVAFERPGHAVGTSAAPPIASECLRCNQVIRGTASIGCCAAEDADGIESGRLIPCTALSRH